MNSYKMKKFPRINTYHMINMKYPVPMQTVVIGWFFHLMASDFIRELLNEINQFCSILKNLNSWEKILKDYSEGMKFNILIEIINPVCMSALNTPYAIKNRFTYASVMLLRETAILLDRNVKCIKFSEENITLKTLKDFECLFKKQEWKSVSSLLGELNRIHSKQYRKNTADFRHKYHHRLPPNIEIGISSLVSRTEDKDGSISYSIGGEFPLPISKLLTSLHSEYEACIKAFQTFWSLLEEQLEIWKQKC